MTTNKSHRFDLGGRHWIVERNGVVVVVEPGVETFVSSIGELLYAIQEVQEHFGGLPVQVNLSEWRGISGKPE